MATTVEQLRVRGARAPFRHVFSLGTLASLGVTAFAVAACTTTTSTTPAVSSTPAASTPGETTPTSAAEEDTAVHSNGQGRTLGEKRDPRLQPFSADSVWNTPIGSGAQLVPAGLGDSYTYVALDRNHLIVASADDPAVPVVRPGTISRCSGDQPYVDSTGEPLMVVIPAAVLIDDVAKDYTPDNNIAVLQPDGETVMEFSAAARCEPGGPLFGWHQARTDLGIESMAGQLSGDGLYLGANGGSGLTALGGAIRVHEVDGDGPIPHALRLSFPVFDYAQADGKCRVWPAKRHDSYACNANVKLDYFGDGPVTIGSLLALDPALNLDELGLELQFSRRLAETLQAFGAYTAVTTSSYDAGRVQIAFEGTQAAPYFTSTVLAPIQGVADVPEIASPWLRDWNRIIPQLNVVTNNGPSSIGGGGEPLAASPPELSAAAAANEGSGS